MFKRKDAVSLAVLSLLASTGLVMADTTDATNTGLSLKPVIRADDAPADRAPLMMGLDKLGAGPSLDKLGLNIYGFVDSGYTWNHRHDGTSFGIIPGPFNHEVGNHYMLNQVDLRFERLVDSKKWDVGGMVELMYGTDAAALKSDGLELGDVSAGTGTNADTSEHNGKGDRFSPQYQFDITQAYLDVNVPVGNGLKVRAGKFVALAGYEVIDPRGNAFYSHSYLFSQVPGTQTGVLGFYTLNDQWTIIAGMSRGWDQSLEDNNGSPDALGEVVFTPNKQWSFVFNWITGPENSHDTSHYRTLIDPIATWQVTDKLKLGAEFLYVYDGGRNGSAPSESHAYGDVWGAALYASYTVNDYITVNGRAEKAHSYDNFVSGYGAGANLEGVLGTSSVPTVNAYEVTLGLNIIPLPKDALGKNLMIRPEVRYDFTDGDKIYVAGGNVWKDQLTFACDFIVKF